MRVVSIIGSFFRAGEETYFLIYCHSCLCSKDVCPPGWSFYNGSCYFTSEKCETWTNASLICRSMGANLPAIESQEENVYIQHRHNGDKAWIGLNDIATEGVFAWVDGCPFKFRYWAKNQPNNFREEDCVHTLGPGHGYMWNDVDCSTCHQYTCKKGNWNVFLPRMPVAYKRLFSPLAEVRKLSFCSTHESVILNKLEEKLSVSFLTSS